MEFKTFATELEWIEAAALFMEETLTLFPGPLALSGGSTPMPVYEAVATRGNIQSHSIEVYQVDERFVPADHPDSNQQLITKHLILPDTKPMFCSFTPFRTDLSLEEAVKKYEKALSWIKPTVGGFALTVLGLGPDGHTASLFPHSPALKETKQLVAHTTTDQFPVHDRLTLTFPAIMASKSLLLLIKGKEKKPILDDLLHSSKMVDELPAKKLLEHPNLTIYFCTI